MLQPQDRVGLNIGLKREQGQSLGSVVVQRVDEYVLWHGEASLVAQIEHYSVRGDVEAMNVEQGGLLLASSVVIVVILRSVLARVVDAFVLDILRVGLASPHLASGLVGASHVHAGLQTGRIRKV